MGRRQNQYESSVSAPLAFALFWAVCAVTVDAQTPQYLSEAFQLTTDTTSQPDVGPAPDSDDDVDLSLIHIFVDDNPAIHEDYRKILEAQPVDGDLDELSALVLGEDQEPSNVPQFKLHSAYQGQEALEMVKQAIADGQPFAMAFVDMRMPPGWDGLQTIEHLWKVDSNLQVVICTAFSDYSWSEIIDRVEHRDRLLILKKPFDNVEVCQLAISLTHKWELERQAENRMDSIVETAADGIITLDATSAIESCNRAACELFGYSEEELLSTPFCLSLIHISGVRRRRLRQSGTRLVAETTIGRSGLLV